MEREDRIREVPTVEAQNPYAASTLVMHLKQMKEAGQPLRIAFLDIDSNLTGNPSKAVELRELLEERSFGVVFVTSRTEEMVVSRASYERSSDLASRPAPHLAKGEGEYEESFADEVPHHSGLYDPGIIAGTTGKSIFVRQESREYREDKRFSRGRGEKIKDKTAWRQEALEVVRSILEEIDPEGEIARLELIEDPTSFENGIVDVAPPDVRIQVNFAERGRDTFAGTGITDRAESGTEEVSGVVRVKQQEFRAALRRRIEANPQLAPLLHLTNDSNPASGRYSFYITPHYGSPKARAVEHIVKHICKEVGVERNELNLFIAGDSFPDLQMIIEGGLQTRVLGVLAHGSRLNNIFNDSAFAGESLHALQKRTQGEGGILKIKPPLSSERRLIIGDEYYPESIDPIDPVIAAVKEFYLPIPML